MQFESTWGMCFIVFFFYFYFFYMVIFKNACNFVYKLRPHLNLILIQKNIKKIYWRYYCSDFYVYHTKLDETGPHLDREN